MRRSVMVKLSSPKQRKNIRFRIKQLLGITASEEFDSDRLLVVDLEKGDAIALIDRNDNVLELSRNKRGHFDVKELRTSKSDG
jgi:hypothetical protein